MGIKFCYIQEGDVIIMPDYDGIAIGIAKNKQLREDLDWKDTLNVEWLIKWYPRKDLSSEFQSILKEVRGPFFNLADFKSDIETLINSDFTSLKESYSNKQERDENIKKSLNT